MNPWCEFAQRDPANVAGGSYAAGYAWRGVLHTTEQDATGALDYPAARDDYYGHTNWPHFTVDGAIVLQHLPITVSARALANPPGGVETNRARAVQIEVVGRAALPDWDDDTVATVAKLMRWIEDQTSIQRVAPAFVGYPASYGAGAPQRMTAADWTAFNGWCGHQHVPENHHGDPGAIPIGVLLEGDDLALTPKQRQDLIDDIAKAAAAAVWDHRINDDPDTASKASTVVSNILRRVKQIRSGGHA